jgi:hypothetical protein
MHVSGARPRRWSGIAALSNFSDAPLAPGFLTQGKESMGRASPASTPGLPIGWMARIDGPAIDADSRVKAPPFDALLAAGVTSSTERLQRSENELIRIAVMRLDVISARGRNYLARGQAHPAERFKLQLQLGPSAPVFGSM